MDQVLLDDVAAGVPGENVHLLHARGGFRRHDDAVIGLGIDATLEQIREIRRAAPTLPLDETLLDVGYDLLEAARLADAVAILGYNISLHPTSAYSYDGLGDAALAKGDIALAKRQFETSLKIDPTNRYAIDALKRMSR